MRYYGDLDIRTPGELLMDSRHYEGGILIVQDDIELRNIPGPEDCEAAITLHDHLINIYDIENDNWLKQRPLIHPKKSNYDIQNAESGVFFTDGENSDVNHIQFILPQSSPGLFYNFIKTKYTPSYRFSIQCSSNDYIDGNLESGIQTTSPNNPSLMILCIDWNQWISVKKIGTWIII